MSIVLDEQESKRTSPNGSSADVENYREYKYRWVITALYYGLAMTNQMLWVTCTPITTNLEKIYDVSQLVVNLSGLMAMFVYIPAEIPLNYIIDTFGIKIGLAVGAILQVVGAWIRMFAYKSFSYVLVGQVLAGLAQPVMLDTPQKISAFWTVPKKRTTFTTILTLSSIFGVGFGFLLPGVIVGSEESLVEGKRLFMKLLLIEAIITTVLNIPFFIFFRERPPTPPSASANIKRDNILKGFKSLLKNRSYLLLLLAQGISIGIINTLGTVMESFVEPFGLSQLDSSILGILLLVLGLFGSLTLGIIAERTRKFKRTVVFGNGMGMIACAIFVGCLYSGNLAAITTITCVLGFFNTAMLPVGLEFAAELTFPVGEALSGGAINGLSQVTGIAQVFIVNGIMTMSDAKKGALISMGSLCAWMVVSFICSVLLTENLVRSKHDQIHSKKEDKGQKVVKDAEIKSHDLDTKPNEPQTKANDPEVKLVAVV